DQERPRGRPDDRHVPAQPADRVEVREHLGGGRRRAGGERQDGRGRPGDAVERQRRGAAGRPAERERLQFVAAPVADRRDRPDGPPARVRVNMPLFGADGRNVRSWTSVVKLAGPAPLYSGENVPPDVPPTVIVWVSLPAPSRTFVIVTIGAAPVRVRSAAVRS